MEDIIQPMHLPISLKDIGIPSKFEYQKTLIYRIEDFIKRLRWKCYFIGPPTFNAIMYDKTSEKESQCTQENFTQCQTQVDPQNEIPEFEERQWYGFKSENTPPVIKELIRFENELYKLVRKLKFRKVNDNFQNMIKDDLRSISNSKEIIVPADKSPILYKIPVEMYKKLLREEVKKKYEISSESSVTKLNQETLELLEKHEPGLETRVEIFSRADAFVTVKDHKPSFQSKIEVRLINPAKPQIGKISKKKLQDINANLRSITNLNQLQSTNDAISWFESLKCKNGRHF